jgi:hypothetical protein
MISKIKVSWRYILFNQNNQFFSKLQSNKKYLKYFDSMLDKEWKKINREGAKKIRQGMKGQNLGQAEEAFKVMELVH